MAAGLLRLHRRLPPTGPAGVVRLYESAGGRARTWLTAAFPVAAARITDLLERPLHPAVTEENGIVLDLRPFQILTVRLTPA
ncbi:glycosyl hydrolase-related protein [Streptomyces sp. RMIT01]